MKTKITAIIICVILLFALSACRWNETENEAGDQDGRMTLIYNDGFAIIYKDNETGVQYFSRVNCGTCVMVNTNPRVPDSTVTNKAYAERAVELGHGIISSCEHGYQGRYIEAYELHKEYNLKCLIGAEAYWVKDRKEADGTNCHIFLGAMNENGRRSINRVLSEANLTGFYRQARVDPELILSLPKDDVIVTSACVAFWRYEDVDSFVEELRGHFGDHFFLEVQYHNTDLQKDLNSRILRLHDSLKIPIIMGCDSHYITSNGGKERQDFLQARGMEYPDEKGWYLDYPDGDTAYDRFLDQGVLSQSQIQDAMNALMRVLILAFNNGNSICCIKRVNLPTTLFKEVTAISTHMSNEQKRKDATARLWLSYFNRVLYEKGIITEREYSQMSLKIDSRKTNFL